MSPTEEFKFIFEVFYGKKSTLNFMGKVVFFPFILSWACMDFVLELLFTKRSKA